MKTKFEEHDCEFKNSSECEEELDQEGVSFFELERDHYGDE